MGSTICISTALAQGINTLFGTPLDTDSVRRLVALNYTEPYQGKLVLGTETGVGSQLTSYGGFTIVSDNLHVVYSDTFLPNYHVGLIFPRAIRRPHQEPQDISELNRIKEEDTFFRLFKAYTVLLDLLPALHREEFAQIGDIIWRFQFGGNNLLEFDKYQDRGKSILDIMRFFRYSTEPKPIVGLSSLGPLVFVLHENESTLLDLCTRCGEQYYLTQIDNTGLTIEEIL
jgi:predicted sugar kinase